MRKNRFLAIQKIAEQKKLNVDGGPDGDHAPKQTVSNRQTRQKTRQRTLKNRLPIGYLLVGTLVPGGAFQSPRSQGTQQGRHPREHRERRPGRRRGGRGVGRPHPPAHHPPREGHQQAVRNHALGHRQVLEDRVSSVLRVFQSHVLDYLPTHFRRCRGRLSAVGGGQVNKCVNGALINSRAFLIK